MLLKKVCGPKKRLASLHLLVLFALLVCASLVLSSCDNSVARTPRMSDVWSKGLPLGLASLNNRVGFAVDQASNVYTVWGSVDRELRFVRLDERAQVLVDQDLDLMVIRPQQPMLALDAEGNLHLLWLDKQDQDLRVMYARLSGDGGVLQAATVLSAHELRAARTAMVLDPTGKTVQVFWSDTSPSRPGLYHAALDWAGNLVVPEEILVPDGLIPAAQIDSDGYVHLAWKAEKEAGDPEFRYAAYDPRRQALGPELKVGKPVVQASLLGGPSGAAKFDGPYMGLDGGLVYLAWTLEVRERGNLAVFTFYQTFPLPVFGVRDARTAFDYALPEVVHQPVFVRGAHPSLTGDPSFLTGQPKDQSIACFTQAHGPQNLEMLQSAVLGLQAGQLSNLEVVSATPGASLNPSIAVDEQGHRHLVWIDTAGFERYKVIYASTSPQVGEVLNPVTVGEVLNQGLELAFGAVTVIGFLPLYLMWALPGFFVLLIIFLATQEADRDQPRAGVALWVSIGIHAAVQLATAGGALERLSGGGFLSTPAFEVVARWVLPLLVSGLAFLVLKLYIRRTGTLSIFTCFFVYVVANALLYSLFFLTPLLLLG